MSGARTPRRGLVGASLAILAAGAATGVVGGLPLLPGQHDAALVAACGEYMRLRAIQKRDDRERFLADEDADALVEAVNEQLATVEDMTPETRDGRRAKAAAAHDALLYKVWSFPKKDWREQATISERIALDVLADLAQEGRQHG